MTTETTYTKLFNSAEPVLVGFSTTKNLSSIQVNSLLQEVIEGTTHPTETIHLNFEQNKELAKRLGVDNAPSFIIFDQNRLKWRHNGSTNSSHIKYLLKLAHKGRLDINDLYGS